MTQQFSKILIDKLVLAENEEKIFSALMCHSHDPEEVADLEEMIFLAEVDWSQFLDDRINTYQIFGHETNQ